jgi:RNA polymerase sigma-70 factor (ECF subfamily)
MQDSTTNNEATLVKQLAKGNILAFNTLYKAYSGRLYRFSMGYLKSEEEAEELVQEVFTLIWEKRKELKEELSFKSFLFTIAFNLIRKHFRTKAYLMQYLASQPVEESDMATSGDITYNSLYQYAAELVRQLPSRCREVFIKSRFEGLTIKDIAREMKISHKTVENQLTKALHFLRTKLNKEDLPVVLFFMLFML